MASIVEFLKFVNQKAFWLIEKSDVDEYNQNKMIAFTQKRKGGTICSF